MKLSKQELIYKIVEQHYNSKERDALFSRALRRVGELWAEDCVQTAYERAIKYHESLPIDYVGINRYMQIVLTNVINDYANNRVEHIEIDEKHKESRELDDERSDKDYLKKVLEYLKEYDEDSRGIIYMMVFQGEKAKDISTIYSVREDNIRKICQRFKEAVRDKF